MMKNNSRSIFQLQTINNDLLKLKKQLAEFKKLIADDSGMRRQEINLKAQQGLLIKNDKEQKKLSQESEQLSLTIRENESRLYSGKVKTPKEMLELQNELSHQKARLQTLEEHGFTNLAINDELSTKLDLVTREFSDYAAQHEKDMRTWSQMTAEIEDKISQQTSVYNRLKSEIPTEITSHFDRLLLTKNQTAVCLVEEDCCEICGTILSKQVVISSRSAEIPNTCPTCNRMLYNNN